MSKLLSQLETDLKSITPQKIFGKVAGIQGMLVEISGIENMLSIGDRCFLYGRGRKKVPCEVVGFRSGAALAMPYGGLDGIGLGAKAEMMETEPSIRPDPSWLGRVINAFGDPIDGQGPLKQGDIPYAIRNNPPPAHRRSRLGGKIDMGVRALNTFLTCCSGQRMGIFAGSGVGKSMLMSMLARYSSAPGYCYRIDRGAGTRSPRVYSR